jgi:hypothetical protein
MALATKANDLGQIIIVFYHEGHLARIGAEGTSYPTMEHVEGEVPWDELAAHNFEALKAMPGLGASQKGEVAWLKKKGFPFMRVDVREGAPDAEAAARMLGARADGLDLGTDAGLDEGREVASKLKAIEAWDHALALNRDLVAGEIAAASDETTVDTLAAKNDLALLLDNISMACTAPQDSAMRASHEGEARGLYEEIIASYTAGDYTAGDGERDWRHDGDWRQNAVDEDGNSVVWGNREQIYTAAEWEGETTIDEWEQKGWDAKTNFAAFWAQRGFSDKARGLIQEVIDGRTAQLGAKHKDTLNAKNILAELLAFGPFPMCAGSGHNVQPIELFEKVVAGLTEQLGAGHTDTLRVKENLAVLLHAHAPVPFQAQALELLEEVIAGYTEHLGAGHADTLYAKENLANIKMGAVTEHHANPRRGSR